MGWEQWTGCLMSCCTLTACCTGQILVLVLIVEHHYVSFLCVSSGMRTQVPTVDLKWDCMGLHSS